MLPEATPAQDRACWGLDRMSPDQAETGGWRLLVRRLPMETVARHARALLREVLAKAGADDDQVADAALAVSELATNADNHATGPYELRVLDAEDQPLWCAIVDGDPHLGDVPAILEKLRRSGSCREADTVDEPPAESGHGLLIVHRLARGRCQVFPTVFSGTGRPAKAVAFALDRPAVRR